MLDYYGIFDDLNEALNYRPDEVGDVAFPVRHDPRAVPQDVPAGLGSVPTGHCAARWFTRCICHRDEDIARCGRAEKQFDTGYRNLRVLLYEALQPDEQLRDYVRPYAWLRKLYMLYRKKFYPDASKSIGSHR